MKLKNKHRIRMNVGVICSLAILTTSVPVMATSTENLEKQSSSLQSELDGINSEILNMSTEIANIEIQIDTTNNAIVSTEEQLSIIRNTEAQQYDEMKKRIQYMYENGNSNLLELLFSAENLADFVNNADFISNISTYDQKQVDALKSTLSTIKEQQDNLNSQKTNLQSMEADLNDKKEALNTKASETSTSITSISAKISEIKAEEQQAAAKAAAEAAASAAATDPGASGSSSGGNSSAPDYSYPNTDGALSPSKGVVYFNGHRETYYSQRVLPGYGLNIPGRHVASDGTIRDIDNYICVASSDLAKGTVVETSLGMGKVYDSGCASGTIDIYTDW